MEEPSSSVPAFQRSNVLRRPLWMRLGLLVLIIAGLAGASAVLGRGFAPSAGSVAGQTLTTATAPAVHSAATPAPAAAAVPTAEPAQPAAVPTVVSQAPAPVASAPQHTSSSNADQAGEIDPAPAAVVGWPALIEERFDFVSASWPERQAPTWSTVFRDGMYELRLNGRPSVSYSNPLRGRDFWMESDVQIERGSAGLFFLRNQPNDFYRFLVDETGRFRFEVQQVGASQPLIEWTDHNAIRRGAGAHNHLAVWRNGDELKLYANGEMLASYALLPGNTLEGRVGVALDAPDGLKEGAALFDNLVVRAPAE